MSYEVVVVLSSGIEQIQYFDDIETAKVFADKCVHQDGAMSASIYPVNK